MDAGTCRIVHFFPDVGGGGRDRACVETERNVIAPISEGDVCGVGEFGLIVYLFGEEGGLGEGEIGGRQKNSE